MMYGDHHEGCTGLLLNYLDCYSLLRYEPLPRILHRCLFSTLLYVPLAPSNFIQLPLSG